MKMVAVLREYARRTSRFAVSRAAKYRPRELKACFAFETPGNTLILVRPVRPLRSGLRTELADQPVIPEQKHIRLKADILTIWLPRIDQSVNLITVMDLAPLSPPDPETSRDTVW